MIQIQDNSQVQNDPVVVPEPNSQTTNQVPVADNNATFGQNQNSVDVPVVPPTPINPVKVDTPADNPVQGLVGDIKAPEPALKVEEASASMNLPSTESQVNEDEINDLLAQLEKLSKEIEEKADTNEVVSNSPAVQAPENKEEANSAVNSQFDMDKFLSDLEKKIDQENNLDEEDLAFRKNRVADLGGTAVDDELEAVSAESTDTVKVKPKVKIATQDLEKEVDDLLEAAVQMKDEMPTVAIKEEVNELTDELESSPVGVPKDESDFQSLESQRIFEMLNIDEISNEEREEFLTELEELIWDDFIETDLQLMLTTEEYAGAKEILDSQKEENQKKEELLVYLEKILPDIEEVMYEKAIGLKEEMFMERIRKMKEAASGDDSLLASIAQVEAKNKAGQWQTAVEILNQS